MLRLMVTWFLNALALFLLPYIVPSIHVASYRSALVAALVLGFINTLIRPILVLLTLGLFIFVINGLLFWLVGSFISGFSVDGFWSGVFGAIVYSIISWLLASLIRTRSAGEAS